MKAFLRERLVKPVADLLTQGITVEKIALSLAFGVSLGIFPVLGSTSLLCAIAAVRLRLNLPAIQLVNWFVYPLQVALLVPFIRGGEILFGARPMSLSLAQLMAMMQAGMLHALSTLWLAGLRAISVWILVSPLLTFLLYLAFSRLVRRLALVVPTRPDSAQQA